MKSCSNFKKNFKERTEEGGSTLLTVMLVGMLVLGASAMLASTVAFSVNMNKQQVDGMKATTAQQNVLNHAEAYIQTQMEAGGAVSTATRTVPSGGTYRIHYSTSVAKPTSGITTATSIPANTTWLIIKVTINSKTTDFFYRVTPATTKENVTPLYVDKMRLVTSTNTLIDKAPGVPVLPEVVNNTTATSGLSVTNSTINTNLLVRRNTAVIGNLTNNTINGSIMSSQTNNLNGTTVNGDYCANVAGSTNTTGVKGTVANRTTCLPTATSLVRETVLPANMTATMSPVPTALTATQCTTWAQLKTALEAASGTAERVFSAMNCASWTALSTTEAKKLTLKAPVTILAKNGGITNLTVVPANNISTPITFNYIANTTGTTTINNLKHENGMKGSVYLLGNAGTQSVNNSVIMGSVHGASTLATATNALQLINTKIYYTPTTTKLIGATGAPASRQTFVRVS